MNNLNQDYRQSLVSQINRANHTIVRTTKNLVTTTYGNRVKETIVSERYREVEFKTFALEVIDSIPHTITGYKLSMNTVQRLDLEFGDEMINGESYKRVLVISSSSNRMVALSLAYGLKNNDLGYVLMSPSKSDFLFSKKHIEKKGGNDIEKAMKEFLDTTYETAVRDIRGKIIMLQMQEDVSLSRVMSIFGEREWLAKMFMVSLRSMKNDRSLKVGEMDIDNYMISPFQVYRTLLNSVRYDTAVGIKRYSNSFYEMVMSL